MFGDTDDLHEEIYRRYRHQIDIRQELVDINKTLLQILDLLQREKKNDL